MIRIAVVGLGKIAQDQHLPAIARSSAFELVATVSLAGELPGVPMFRSVTDLLKSGIAVDAVAMCQPPQPRFEAAALALRAGKSVLLEKPPGVALSEVDVLTSLAQDAGSTLFAAWHSRFAAGVAPARAWLAGRRVTDVEIRWEEDVRRWHPGQQWIWDPGGLGVFDPGINALSIATEILPDELRLEGARLEVPANRAMPIAAFLRMRSGDAPVDATFDWRRQGPQSWDIRIDTEEGRLHLADGGARLLIDGIARPVEEQGEYPALYRRFAVLMADGRSDVDPAPLRLVADAFLRGEKVATAAFED